jgi:hypothetical protein
MANTKILITLGKSLLSYDPTTGVFIWEAARRKPFLSGTPAGRLTPNGYVYINADGKMHSASRLAWKAVNGELPDNIEIDHINRIKDDNRICNLRCATRAENLRNRAFKKNLCGFTGVSLHTQSGLYRARYKGVTRYAKTAEDASALYAKLIEDRL